VNISNYLKKMGFRQNSFDECVFMKRNMIVLLYVDDILVTSPSLGEIHWLEAELKAKYGDVESVYVKKFTYLGVLLSRQEDGSIHLSMPQYVEDIVRSEDGIKEYCSPADEYLFNEDPNTKALEPPKQKAFHSTVMKLMYMAKRVRGDVLLPVLWLSTRVKSPTVSDENKLKRVIGYLKRTRERCKVISTDEIKRVEIFIDASFASHHDGAGHSAIVTLVGTIVTILRSPKQ